MSGKASPETKRRATKKCADKKRIVIQQIKARPCQDCNIQYPYWIMDFDHVRGDKLFNLGVGANKSMTKLLAEIEKCDVVCANCHRNRSYARRNFT